MAAFFGLPAELRTMIYEYVLGGYTFGSCRRGPAEPHTLALLRVNRQIHAEASLLPFTLGTFIFRRQSTILKFLNSHTQSELRAIRTLQVETNCAWYILSSWEVSDQQSLSYLVRLPGIKRVEIVERYGALKRPVVKARMRKLAGWIHYWRPEVEVAAWFRSGTRYWTVTNNESADENGTE
jgi:hypothetical protein